MAYKWATYALPRGCSWDRSQSVCPSEHLGGAGDSYSSIVAWAWQCCPHFGLLLCWNNISEPIRQTWIKTNPPTCLNTGHISGSWYMAIYCQHSELSRREIIWNRLRYHNRCSSTRLCVCSEEYLSPPYSSHKGWQNVASVSDNLQAECVTEKNGTWLMEQYVSHPALLPHMSNQEQAKPCVWWVGGGAERERKRADWFLCRSQPWISLVFQT